MTIEKITVPAQPGLDPVYAYFEDLKPGQGRVTLICYDMAWTAWWGGIGKGTMKEFFIDAGLDYLHGNFGRGRQYKRGSGDLAYLRKVIAATHDYLKPASGEDRGK